MAPVLVLVEPFLVVFAFLGLGGALPRRLAAVGSLDARGRCGLGRGRCGPCLGDFLVVVLVVLVVRYILLAFLPLVITLGLLYPLFLFPAPLLLAILLVLIHGRQRVATTAVRIGPLPLQPPHLAVIKVAQDVEDLLAVRVVGRDEGHGVLVQVDPIAVVEPVLVHAQAGHVHPQEVRVAVVLPAGRHAAYRLAVGKQLDVPVHLFPF